MIFSCDRCGRRYSVPDERVQGRAFRVTCKSCANVIVVRPGSPAAAPAPGPAASPPPAAAPPPAASASPAARPSPAQPAAAAAPPPRPAPRPAPPPENPPLSPWPDDSTSPPTVPVPRPATSAPTVPIQRAPAAAADPFAVPASATHEPGRGLTAAEMAWMSEHPPAADGGASATVEVAPPPPEEEVAPERAVRRGPGLLRVTIAAVILGVAAAVAVALVWPGWRSKPPPPAVAVKPPPAPPPSTSTPPAPPPPPTPEPAPVAAAPAPEPAAPAPQPTAARPEPSPVRPAAATSRSGPGARFEPGTVRIGKARRRESHHLSKKDRKLLDLLARKGDESPPPEPVEKLDLDTGRSLDPAAVERVMQESQGAFTGCVTRASKSGGRLPDQGHATLLLTVASSGEVSTAWVAESELSRSGLGRCLVGAARRLAFPAFEGDPVDVSIPLVLEAR